jgi:hypothetical protein
MGLLADSAHFDFLAATSLLRPVSIETFDTLLSPDARHANQLRLLFLHMLLTSVENAQGSEQSESPFPHGASLGDVDVEVADRIGF